MERLNNYPAREARANNYDCLRVYAMFMVILNHVADVYFNRSAVPSLTVYLFEGISHSAVPLFLMLTGAFLIDKVQGVSPKDFYMKSFKKLGIPTIVFTLIYWIKDYATGRFTLAKIFITLIRGFQSYYAHWYVVMLAGIYAILPFIAVIKNNLPSLLWKKMAVIFFIWSILSRWMDTPGATWTTGTVFSFLGYVLLGDILKNREWKKSNPQGIGLFITANILLLLNYFVLFKLVINGGNYFNKFLNLYGAPAVAASAVMIFSAFSKMTFKINASHLASYSFLIFLSHKLVISIIRPIIFAPLEKIMNFNLKIIIPTELVIIFIISYIVSYIYMRVERRLHLCRKANVI